MRESVFENELSPIQIRCVNAGALDGLDEGQRSSLSAFFFDGHCVASTWAATAGLKLRPRDGPIRHRLGAGRAPQRIRVLFWESLAERYQASKAFLSSTPLIAEIATL